MDKEKEQTEQNGEGRAAEQEQRREDIIELGSITARSAKGVIHCLTIVGQIVIEDSGYLL